MFQIRCAIINSILNGMLLGIMHNNSTKMKYSRNCRVRQSAAHVSEEELNKMDAHQNAASAHFIYALGIQMGQATLLAACYSVCYSVRPSYGRISLYSAYTRKLTAHRITNPLMTSISWSHYDGLCCQCQPTLNFPSNRKHYPESAMNRMFCSRFD